MEREHRRRLTLRVCCLLLSREPDHFVNSYRGAIYGEQFLVSEKLTQFHAVRTSAVAIAIVSFDFDVDSNFFENFQGIVVTF